MNNVTSWAKQHRLACLVSVAFVFLLGIGSIMALPRLTSLHALGAGKDKVPPCGSPLAMAGYSITTDGTQLSTTLGTAKIHPEFSLLRKGASFNAAIGLGHMYIVHEANLSGDSVNNTLQNLDKLPHVKFAEPIWLQSSTPAYFSCDYKLKDNTKAQSVAKTARLALLAQGVPSAILDDLGTMEFVSQRHFQGKQMLQVAFVYLPASGPAPVPGSQANAAPTPVPTVKSAYIAILDPQTLTVVDTAAANWFN